MTHKDHERDRFAAVVLEVAIQVEAAEKELRAAILRSAEAGDQRRVLDILRHWVAHPPVRAAALTLGSEAG